MKLDNCNQHLNVRLKMYARLTKEEYLKNINQKSLRVLREVSFDEDVNSSWHNFWKKIMRQTKRKSKIGWSISAGCREALMSYYSEVVSPLDKTSTFDIFTDTSFVFEIIFTQSSQHLSEEQAINFWQILAKYFSKLSKTEMEEGMFSKKYNSPLVLKDRIVLFVGNNVKSGLLPSHAISAIIQVWRYARHLFNLPEFHNNFLMTYAKLLLKDKPHGISIDFWHALYFGYYMEKDYYHTALTTGSLTGSTFNGFSSFMQEHVLIHDYKDILPLYVMFRDDIYNMVKAGNFQPARRLYRVVQTLEYYYKELPPEVRSAMTFLVEGGKNV